MGDGGGSEKTKSVPWSAAKPYLQDIMSEGSNIYQQSRSAGPVGLDPYQTQGMDAQAAYARGDLQGMVDTTMEGSNFLTSGDVLSPDSNPYLRETSDAYADAVNEQLQRTTLSGIDDQFQQAGQGWNASRQGIERGLARGEASESIAQNTAGMYSDAYGRGLDAMRQGIALAPQTAQLGATPSGLLSDVGAQRRQQEMYEQQYPQQQLGQFANMTSQIAGHGQTQIAPQSSGGAAGALGGAAAGAAIGSKMYPGWGTAIGAIGGGLLGYQ